ncbi:hypothetical protein [Kitasatospora sp. NPDC001547]|uniref:hypothetical protein n=1 Tax=Kitasatospora sp. NPDC001547 TaxID=3364015 RepID=UPI0036AE187D
MSRKHKRAVTLAQIVAALPSPVAGKPGGAHVGPPVRAGGFTDADGCCWRLARGPLDPRRARRLSVEADMMSMGTCYDERVGRWLPRFLTAAERPAAWLEARARFGVDDLPIHEAYEFTADDGRVLLFIETYC